MQKRHATNYTTPCTTSNTNNQKQCTCEPSSGEFAMEVAMAAEISDEEENGEYALTEARQLLQSNRGGRGGCGAAVGEVEMTTVWWCGC